MTRTRIESHATSPKLIPTTTRHTPVESTGVCNVYQPLVALYFVLIMNNASNMLRDIEDSPPLRLRRC
jgi:hypothetical protein